MVISQGSDLAGLALREKFLDLCCFQAGNSNQSGNIPPPCSLLLTQIYNLLGLGLSYLLART